MSILPGNRIPEILKRMDVNSSQAEAMKTCFGILAIMSREESNKATIAKDGMEIMLNAMTIHIDRTDVQEAGCDLLWSLAFNSTNVKEIIAKYNGAIVLVRALKRHSRSPDFLKSACGALSNICQYRANQEAVAYQGGLQPLVGSIHIHQTNAKLLPFIFDAIASIIVNNEENARSVSSLGIIPVIVASLSRHKLSREVVKSGCHTLAILSDVKGQASKIAFAGGVPIILSLLDMHPLYADLHRVAAVVLLRMLQESSHVAREICCHEGVRILLYSLEKGGAQQDTVAAVTHILYTVTNPNTAATNSIENQLWYRTNSTDECENNGLNSIASTINNGGNHGKKCALGGIIAILKQYLGRRDVIRATCRLIMNLSCYDQVIMTFDSLHVLDYLFECANTHKDAKDVLEACSLLTKGIAKRKIPQLYSMELSCLQGVQHVLQTKSHDEDIVYAFLELLHGFIENVAVMCANKQTPAVLNKTISWDILHWCNQVIMIYCSLVEKNENKTSKVPLSAKLLSRIYRFLEMLHRSEGPLFHHQQEYFHSTAGTVGGDSAAITIPSSANPHEGVTVASTIRNLLRSIHIDHPELSGIENLTILDNPDTAAGITNMNSKPGSHSQSMKSLLHGNDEIHVLEQQLGYNTRNSSSGGSRGNNGMISFDGNGKMSSNSSASELLAHHQKSTSSLLHSIQQQQQQSNMDDMRGVNDGQHKMNNSSSHQQLAPPNTNCNSSAYLHAHQNQHQRLLPKNPYLDHAGKYHRLLCNWPNYLERLLSSPNTQQFSSLRFSGTETAIPSRMHICYESGLPGGRNIVSKFPVVAPYNVPSGGVGSPFEHSLTFDSEFESGNLYRAVQVGDASYDLFLRPDIHTQGHTQWFYFAVSNTHPVELVKLSDQGVVVPSVRVTFQIVNFTKPDSLFNLGMRPVCYSFIDAKQKSIGWVRSGSDIAYYSNTFCRNNNAGEGSAVYYTLSFTIEFQHPKDTVYIAYSYPYTLTDYRLDIDAILQRSGAENVIRRAKLCTTMGGEDCDLLVITDYSAEREKIGHLFVSDYAPTSANQSYNVNQELINFDESVSNKFMKNYAKRSTNPLKPALFFSGRVHPGETPASWMMKGMLDFLTSDTASAKLLRQIFVIFVVPILNPDGVVNGNNRCSLAGVDLNRQWKVPSKMLHPTVYALKSLMMAQRKVREIAMYIDLHGHSRKYNVFMYGCDEKKKPRPQVRSFPKLLSQHPIGGKYVCFEDCSFHIKKGRESTARVVVSKELNIPYSFTLEATFCGANYGPLKNCHMNIGHLQEVGAALCDAVLQFSIAEGYSKDFTSIVGGPMTSMFTSYSQQQSQQLHHNMGSTTSASTPFASLTHKKELAGSGSLRDLAQHQHQRVKEDSCANVGTETSAGEIQESTLLNNSSMVLNEEDGKGMDLDNDPEEEVDSDSEDEGEGDGVDSAGDAGMEVTAASLLRRNSRQNAETMPSQQDHNQQQQQSGIAVQGSNSGRNSSNPSPSTLMIMGKTDSFVSTGEDSVRTTSGGPQKKQHIVDLSLLVSHPLTSSSSSLTGSKHTKVTGEVIESLSVRTHQEFEKLKAASMNGNNNVLSTSLDKSSISKLAVRKSSDASVSLVDDDRLVRILMCFRLNFLITLTMFHVYQ